jgi:hypothetical protein
LATKVYTEENLAPKKAVTSRLEAKKAWLYTPQGAKAKRIAYEMSINTTFDQAKKWLETQFLEANPEFKTALGRPSGAVNRKTRLIIAAGKVISELLNKASHEI